MKYQFVFDLQRFDDSDDAIEIPEELEGVSREVALEVMREEGMISPKNAEPTDDTNDDEETGEQEEDNQDGQAADADSVTKQKAEKTDPQPVPYKRFSEINAAKTKAEADLAAAMAKLAAYEQQQKAPTATTEQAPQANQAPQQDYESLFDAEARKRFAAEHNGREFDDEFASSKDASDFALTRFELKQEVNQAMEQQQAQAHQAEEKQAVVNTAWQNMLTELSANNDDYQDIIKFALTDKFNASDDLTKQALMAADSRVKAGRPAAEDVILLRRYYAEAAEEFHAQSGEEQKQPVPVPKVPLGQQKLEKMAAHPRVGNIKGTGDVGGFTTAEATRMVNEMPWDKVPKAVKDWVMNG